MVKNYKELGLMLRQGRLNAGWSIKVFGEKLHVHRDSIQKWENGSRRPRPQTLKIICNLLDLDDEVLFETAGYQGNVLTSGSGITKNRDKAKSVPQTLSRLSAKHSKHRIYRKTKRSLLAGGAVPKELSSKDEEIAKTEENLRIKYKQRINELLSETDFEHDQLKSILDFIRVLKSEDE